LVATAAEGSDRGHIIDRALERVAMTNADVGRLVQTFRTYDPGRLPPFPGVVSALRRLRREVPVGLVSDGDPSIQRSKLCALGLDSEFDAIVFSDEHGRDSRKPHPGPFLRAAEELRVRPGECVFVGDRPDKDVTGAAAAGYIGAVRVLTGEYRHAPSVPCLATVDDFPAAVEWLESAYADRARVLGQN